MQWALFVFVGLFIAGVATFLTYATAFEDLRRGPAEGEVAPDRVDPAKEGRWLWAALLALRVLNAGRGRRGSGGRPR